MIGIKTLANRIFGLTMLNSNAANAMDVYAARKPTRRAQNGESSNPELATQVLPFPFTAFNNYQANYGGQC